MIKMPLPSEFDINSYVNPFIAYSAGFGMAIGVYSLGYSDLYPPLEFPLQWFLLATCGISLVLAYLFRNVRIIAAGLEPLGRHVAIFIVIMAAFAIEVSANGGIPLLLITAGADYSYRDFGVPVLHVAFSGFCYFYAVYWFDLYLLRRGGAFLFFSVSSLATALLTFSRGALIVASLAMVAVYIQRRGLSRRLLLVFALLAAGFLWGFGVLGDIRTHGSSSESVILSIGQASDKFRNSNIPTELFWPYLYTSSPLANLQLNITDRVSNDAAGYYFILGVSSRLHFQKNTGGIHYKRCVTNFDCRATYRQHNVWKSIRIVGMDRTLAFVFVFCGGVGYLLEVAKE